MINIIWSRLMEFESCDLVRKYIKAKHNRNSPAWQISEIRCNFIQGREYFRNALNAEMTVKPLLLYYGVAALSRGLILCKQPHRSAASFKPSHGLETLNWESTVSKNNFQDLQVRIREGVFLELLRATENKSYLKNNSNGVNYKIKYTLPKEGTIITLVNLLETFSDLSEQFEKWQTVKIDYLRTSSIKNTSNNELEYAFDQSTDQTIVTKIFPEELYPGSVIEKKFGQLTVTTSCDRIAQVTQKFSDPFQIGIGQIAITHSPLEETCINSLGQFYCLSYYLGMLARYFPGTWVPLGRGAKGDAIYPLIRHSIALIEQYYPMLVYDFLEGPYSFESPNLWD